MSDEIRKAAEEAYELKKELYSNWFRTVDPETLSGANYTEIGKKHFIEGVVHAIREDRKRRDSLEDMLAELAECGFFPSVSKTAKSGWTAFILPATVNVDDKGYVLNHFGTTPTEAVRAALDELRKEKSDE
jgi:hypothetical protein